MGWTARDLLLSCFCCHSLPKFSTVTRSSCTISTYSFIFFTSLILLTTAYFSPGMTKNFPFCKGDDSFICKEHSNFLAVYRIAFTYALFFAIMCIFTLGISSSRNYRSVIHNGFWFFKIAFIACVLVGSAYIPHGLFDRVLMFFGLFFSLSFNLIQMLIFLNALRNFSFYCGATCLKEASSCTKFVVTFFGVFFQIIGVGILLILIFMYKHCVINLVFEIVNVSLSYLISLGSFLIKLQKRDWNSMLGGIVLTSHVMFLTWSAIVNNPRDECNPSRQIAWTLFVANNFICIFAAGFTVFLGTAYFNQSWQKEKPNPVTYVEERGNEFCGIWGKRVLVRTIEQEDSTNQPGGVIYKSTDPDDDEYDHVQYAWNIMHKLFLEAVFYFMICYTYNYVYSTTPSKQIFYNEAAMWFKIVSSWLCMLTFIILEFLPESNKI